MATVGSNCDRKDWTQDSYPQGWGASDISREKIMLRLSAEAIDDIAMCLRTVNESEREWFEVTRTDFSTPALDFELREARLRLRRRGQPVLLKGLCVNEFSQSDVEKIFFGLGMHMGQAVPQGSGDVLTRVGELSGGSAPHGADSKPFPMQTDSAETVALLCVRRAIAGGETVLSSALRAHAIMKDRRPDLLRVLERGFQHSHVENGGVVTSHKVPVFSSCRGLLSCHYRRQAFQEARRAIGRGFTKQEEEALDYLDSILTSPELQFQFQLAPGEILWINNFETLYARIPFENHFDPCRGRLLYRLWLEDTPSRPIQQEALLHESEFARIRVSVPTLARLEVPRDLVALH